jgi:hypothetical protein
MPAALAEDVVSAYWVALPPSAPASRGYSRKAAPQGRGRRSVLDYEAADDWDEDDDGDDTEEYDGDEEEGDDGDDAEEYDGGEEEGDGDVEYTTDDASQEDDGSEEDDGDVEYTADDASQEDDGSEEDDGDVEYTADDASQEDDGSEEDDGDVEYTADDASQEDDGSEEDDGDVEYTVYDGGEEDDGGDESSGATFEYADASSSVAALLLMGLNFDVQRDYMKSLNQADVLNDAAAILYSPAIIVPCGLGADEVTDAVTVQYHGTGGAECDFSVEASYTVYTGGAFERSEERTTPLTKPRKFRCGDLFPTERAEKACQEWSEGVTLAMASFKTEIGGKAVVPDITVDTSVFVYDLAENELPTFVGINDGILDVRVSDFELGSELGSVAAGLPVDTNNGTYPEIYDIILQNFQCSDGSGDDACFSVDYSNDPDGETAAWFMGYSSEKFGFFRALPTPPFPFTYFSMNFGATITPDYAKKMFGGADGTGSGVGMSAMFTSTDNLMSQEDADEANKAFGLPPNKIIIYPGPSGTGNFDRKDGPDERASPGEADMDVQLLSQYGGPGAGIGFIPGLAGLDGGYYSGSECSNIDNIYSVLQRNLNASPPKPLPKVVSLSFGAMEDPSSGSDYCAQSLAKLVSMGVLVLVSSGDDGATSETCSELTAENPTASPLVTSVGAIMDVRMSEDEDPVMATCMGASGGFITSGGGFSEIYDRPKWQEDAVSEYLELDHSDFQFYPGADYNPSGRGYPDVSAYGFNIPIITEAAGGEDAITLSGGTSASSPMVAGLLLQLVARLEEAKVCGGSDITLVQLNKFMYRAAKTHPDAFIDIVYGNTAWGSNIAFCELGFEAREGWDPATGLGAINMPKFTQAAIDMAEEFFCSDTGDDGDANEGAGGGSNDADDDIDGDENAEEDDDSVEYGDGDGDDDENSGGAGN